MSGLPRRALKREEYLEALLEPVIMASVYVADDARPLAEMTAPKRFREGVPFEMRRCPYPHSRKGKPMNVSALRVLALGMKACINDTIRLRRAYLGYSGRTHFDLPSFWRFTRVLDSLPAYLVRRATGGFDPRALPARVSTLFKAAQGLHLAPETLIFDAAPLNSAITTAGLMELIEERGLFMDEGRACAGSPLMVKAFVQSAVSGEGEDLGDDGVFHLLAEPRGAGLFAYSDAVSEVFVAKALFEARSRLRVAKTLEAAPPLLQSAAQRTMGRFGFYRGRDALDLQRAARTLEQLSSASWPEAEAEGPPAPESFIRLVVTRNPQEDPRVLRAAAEQLWAYLDVEREWLSFLEKGQRIVLETLHRPPPSTRLGSRDLEGAGFTLRDVLCEALRIELVHGPRHCVVKAGASALSFERESGEAGSALRRTAS